MPKTMPPPPTEPGPELDAWLAEWLMGWTAADGFWWPPGVRMGIKAWLVRSWTPSTSSGRAIDDILPVMGKRKFDLKIYAAHDGGVKAEFTGIIGGVVRRIFDCHHDFAAAFCLAAAQAIEAAEAAEKVWHCRCGYSNVGPICTHCSSLHEAAEEAKSTPAGAGEEE